MIQECLDYLTQSLINAGIDRVFTRGEDSSKHQGATYAELSVIKEQIKKDGSLVARADGNDDQGRAVRIFRRRTHRWTVMVKVRMVCRDEAALAQVKGSFFGSLQSRIFEAGNNAVLIHPDAGEPEEDTSVLRSKAETYFLIAFEGGIYKDRSVLLINLEDSMEMENEITEVL
ncbi:MAG: hypothetical protein K6T66_13920 [Peptococcaceae bacterium]|nr:hypothetical protein [Peptococcaceae bacterium]